MSMTGARTGRPDPGRSRYTRSTSSAWVISGWSRSITQSLAVVPPMSKASWSGRRPDQLAFDMGGTTAKLCVIERDQPLITHALEVDRVYRLRPGSGLPVRAPVIDMIEIGTGGGSIARVDALGLITTGPDSAGSDPGPVSYRLGGEHATVTDADAVLGYLDPDRFLSGEVSLDVAA